MNDMINAFSKWSGVVLQGIINQMIFYKLLDFEF